MPPEHYITQPKCGCGARDYRIDKWMNQRKTGLNGMGCNCSGYWFMHRRGSKFCWYRASGETRIPGDEDFNDRHMSDEEIAAAAAQI